MKKLTWALLSLMLFLGLGMASAQDLPTPTFSPASGTAVPPGAKINISLSEEIMDNADEHMAVIVLYVENNDGVELEAADAATLYTAAQVDAGVGTTAGSEGEGERLWKTAMYDFDQEMWWSNVRVSQDATGTVKLRMRLAAITADFSAVYSNDFSAEYTIDANAVAKPTAPTFSLDADGKLSMENGYSDRMHSIVYKINGTDADFADPNEVYEKSEGGDMSAYEGPIDYTAGDVVKAVTLELDMKAGISMSDISTYVMLAAPTFTPASGTVAPGDEITFDIPAEYQNYMTYLFYTTDPTAFAGATTYEGKMTIVEEVTATDDLGDPTYQGPIKAAGYMGGRWMLPCEIPSDATPGTLTLQAFLFITEANIFSEIATASYTVTAAPAPVVIPAPTLNPADGAEVAAGTKVAVTHGFEDAEDSDDYWVYYVIDKPDFDFSEYEIDDDLPLYVKECYGTITINAAMTVKVATAKVKQTMAGNMLTWSDPVTATYTIKADDPTPGNDIPAPVFNPDGGAVAAGTKILLTNGTEGDATPKPIYYNFKNTGSEEFDKVTTQTLLTNALKPGVAGTSPKLMLYQEGIELTEGKTINAATASIDAEGNVTWSKVITKNFTIGAAPTPGTKPAAPTFRPDGGEIEADEDITLETTTQGAKIYYTSGTEASFVSLTTEAALREAVDNYQVWECQTGAYPTLGDLDVETPGEKLSISAAAVLIAEDGGLTWSEVTTKEFTVAGGDNPEPGVTVAPPVITPGNDAAVHIGDMVTIACKTEGAEIYYATDGTEPFTVDNDGYPVAVKDGALKYTEPFALTEEMLIKQNQVWAMKIRAVAVKGDAISPNGGSAGYVVYPNAPTFDPVAGAVEEGTKVTITCVPTVADIYYTTDGTAPTMENSPKYTEPIEITGAMTIKAIAVLGQYQTSASAAYTIKGNEPTPTKPATPTFDPEAGEVPVGTEVYIDCATIGATVHYTTDGSMPTAESDIATFMTAIEITEDMTIKAIAIMDGVSSDMAVGEYTVVAAAPIKAEVSISSFMLNDNTVGKNAPIGLTISDPENPESQTWLYTSPAVIYYTVDGTTVPSKDAYEAQTDKENGAIKMVSTVEDEEYGGNATDTYGNVMSITISEATHLQAIGYLTMGDEEVVTPVFEKDLEVKALDNPAFSISNYKKVASGDKLVIKNPAPAQADDEEEGELKAKEGEEETAAPEGTLFFSFDGTLPTRNAYDAQNPDYEGIDWSDPESIAAADPYGAYKIFKSEPDIEITFGQDERGFYAYVPAIGEFTTNMGHKYDTIRLDEDGFFDVTVWCEGTEKVGKDPQTGWPNSFIFGSDFVTRHYTMNEDFPAVTLTFDPASGAEVDENTAVAITCSDATAEIFYMMFESEEAAKAAEWDQEEALSYSAELKPVLTKEKNTIKAAYAREGAEAIDEAFFYATYKVKELPAITLTFNPASGSEVEDNATVTVTANRETEIFYNVYADEAAADADKETFMANAKEVKEDGMPVIKKGNTYLRCAVTDRGEMKYFNATYTIKVANEGLELSGVSVYPNPSNGLFNLELPCAATVEVFMLNGMLYQRINAAEGNATLNIERSGIYFLRITGEGRTTVKRLIVR